MMDTPKVCEVISLFPDQHDDDSSLSGWDPYIFSIMTGGDRSNTEERRRAPRTNSPARRRALLISKGRRRKKTPS